MRKGTISSVKRNQRKTRPQAKTRPTKQRTRKNKEAREWQTQNI